MNKERRKLLEKAHELITQAAEEEEDAYDNMPDSLQDSERGERMQENFISLQDAAEKLEEV